MTQGQMQLLLMIGLPAFLCGGFCVMAFVALCLGMVEGKEAVEKEGEDEEEAIWRRDELAAAADAFLKDASRAARHRLERAIEEVEAGDGWSRAWGRSRRKAA